MFFLIIQLIIQPIQTYYDFQVAKRTIIFPFSNIYNTQFLVIFFNDWNFLDSSRDFPKNEL